MDKVQPTAAAGELGSDDQVISFKENLKRGAHAALDPLVRALARLGMRADHLTILGLVFGLGAGVLFFAGRFRLGALLAALAGLCDLLDGQVVRLTKSVSRFGAFLDSTLDRLAEAAILVGIAGFYIAHPEVLATGPEPGSWAVAVSLFAMLALVGSFLVSYTRARAEGLGIECKVGWFERTERMVLIIIAGLFGVGPVMPGALVVLVLLSFATAAQRVAYVWKKTHGAGLDR